MRTVQARNYTEPRDALAQSWSAFLSERLPGVAWQPLPSLGAAIVDHVREWQIDAIVLTGGNSIGEAPLRDETEARLLDHAVREGLPVVAICRGLQVLQWHFGGQLAKCPPAHVATRHPIELVGPWLESMQAPAEIDVNSYHEQGIREDELAASLTPLARTADGWVEAARHRDVPLTGVMWHPERESPSRALDERWMRHALGLEVRSSRP